MTIHTVPVYYKRNKNGKKIKLCERALWVENLIQGRSKNQNAPN